MVSRIVFMQHMHKAYPITGTVATGVAARIPGSVVYSLLAESAHGTPLLKIAHPSGLIETEAQAAYSGNRVTIERIAVYRTARMLMDGYVYVRKNR